MKSIFDYFRRKPTPIDTKRKENEAKTIASISPGRVSEPEDNNGDFVAVLSNMTSMVTPSFRREVIPLIRKLYKVNPDVGIALQDMFKLTNTGHIITFPNNTDEEAERMRDHLRDVSKNWSRYTSGMDGLVNKMLVQLMVGGAISIEAVPNEDLDGLSTILFLKPENIYFHQTNNGVYEPYQKVTQGLKSVEEQFIKLNPDTYFYIGMFNDTDEPYGIPPFMTALDSLKGQQDMRINFKHIMDMVGMVGFLEAKIQKPMQKGNESLHAYEGRLNRLLRDLKRNMKDSLKDGIVTGFIDDAEFNLNSTTKELGNINAPWDMNQQSVANGLGVNGSIIGVNSSNTESGSGVVLSKLISQLKNFQVIVSYALTKIYSLELLLAGYNNKGLTITWGTSTISDEVKVQQARQYKIQNLDLLYKAGIISQAQYAWEMGYDAPDQDEPRLSLEDQNGVNNGDPQEGIKKKQRQADKNQSARRTRDKNNPSPKRQDQNSKPR